MSKKTHKKWKAFPWNVFLNLWKFKHHKIEAYHKLLSVVRVCLGSVRSGNFPLLLPLSSWQRSWRQSSGEADHVDRWWSCLKRTCSLRNVFLFPRKVILPFDEFLRWTFRLRIEVHRSLSWSFLWKNIMLQNSGSWRCLNFRKRSLSQSNKIFANSLLLSFLKLSGKSR